jgi:hypothetical protein
MANFWPGQGLARELLRLLSIIMVWRESKMAQQLPEPVDPAAFASLEPDFVLPEQFFPEQQPNWSGELSLLWTVFSDGIETFRKEVLLGRERSEAYTETLEWIELTGQESIFSFDRLCELFQLNPVKVRCSLLTWRDRQRSLANTQRAA